MIIKFFLRAPYHSLSRATEGSSGFDLRFDPGQDPVDDVRDTIVLWAGERRLISTGLYLEMPRGIEAQVRSRSGLAKDHGVVVLNSPGTIDSDYRGEVGVLLINHGFRELTIRPGMKIAQLVFALVLPPPNPEFLVHLPPHLLLQRVQAKGELQESTRGTGGFGSTDRKEKLDGHDA